MLSNKSPSVANMLAEIQTETASQLLSSVLYQTSPPGSTGLPGLDASLMNSSSSRASPTSSLDRGDVLEIQGPAASGKTLLVYYLTMQCILPHKIFLSSDVSPEVEIGGWGRAAVVMDTDGRWNVQRLRSLLSTRLEQMLPVGHTESQPSIQELVSESLQRLHVFQPNSSASLVATLLRLPSYHAERMPSQEIALLAVDSISSFYWIDRYNLEQQRHGPSDRRDGASPLSRILMALQEIRLSHGPVTVLTNWGLSPMSKPPSPVNTDDASAAPSPFYRQHLHPFPAPFEIPPRLLPNAHLMPPITHHITLLLPVVDQIPSQVTSLEEALDMAAERSTNINEGEINGIFRTIETGSITNFTVGR